MSVEDEIRRIREKLHSRGVPTGSWVDVEEKDVVSPTLERQKEALGKVSELLERQIEDDQKQIAQLHVALQRLKHGGGA